MFCYNCLYKEEKLEYLGSIIQFNEDDLNLSIPQCFEKRFQNISRICMKCSWKDGLQLTNFANYSEIIKDLKCPEIIFLFYDIGYINDDNDNIIEYKEK